MNSLDLLHVVIWFSAKLLYPLLSPIYIHTRMSQVNAQIVIQLCADLFRNVIRSMCMNSDPMLCWYPQEPSITDHPSFMRDNITLNLNRMLRMTNILLSKIPSSREILLNGSQLSEIDLQAVLKQHLRGMISDTFVEFSNVNDSDRSSLSQTLRIERYKNIARSRLFCSIAEPSIRG